MFYCIAISFILTVFLSSCNIVGLDNAGSGVLSNSGQNQQEHDISSDQKAELAKNRRKQIRLIRKGDYYMAKNTPLEAIPFYLEALEKLPNDLVIEKKIAEAYYRTKDWTNSYEYFNKVPFSELKDKEREDLFHALFFDDSRTDQLIELKKYPLDIKDIEYYTMLHTCTESIEGCTKFLNLYTGATIKIKNLENVINNASRISPDIAYKNFTLATEFYVMGEYRAAAEYAKNILKDRGDYFDVQKLAGFSLFALGRYTEARDILRKYLEFMPKDSEVIIRLGEISALLKNYTEANLYLNNAIIAGYKNKTNIERALAYNYSQLGDNAAMIKVLSYLVAEEDSREDDFAVAISLAFARGENARAYVWSIEGLKKFPSSPIIAPMYMMSLRIMGRTAEIERFLMTLTPDTLSSPLVQLELGINAFDVGDYTKAKEYLKQVYDVDNDADFGIEAESYLKQIEEKEAQIDNSTQDVPVPTPEEKGWWF